MASSARPAVVWMPNLEVFMLLVNLTEEGTRYQSRAVHPVRRAAWLRYDTRRRDPAVQETALLLRSGFWVDSIAELALAADILPKTGLSYGLSRETVLRAAPNPMDGLERLNRYLELAASFTLQAEALEFLRGQGDAYRGAVSELEASLGSMEWIGSVEQYFGADHRSYLCVASLLMPAGFTFGLSLSSDQGPLAFHVAAPFIEADGSLTFNSPQQAETIAEREMVRAFLRPVLSRGQLAARTFSSVFDRSRDTYRAMGYQQPQEFLEDHLAQVIQARLMARRGDRETSDALLAFDESSGFAFTRPLAAALEDYELHRTDFPTFEAYFPRLMDQFQAA